ncbi:hypothetical protein CRE_22863 [Caenorhabditis remanei]|uniref:Uncharacterized protein n=1 Tax=Caenorhabditis remanei TaxID=31234 RepID=E3MHL8_CAERE|nr:hypothetical protein CRE_22863 [Caenorhabditis remanei]
MVRGSKGAPKKVEKAPKKEKGALIEEFDDIESEDEGQTPGFAIPMQKFRAEVAQVLAEVAEKDITIEEEAMKALQTASEDILDKAFRIGVVIAAANKRMELRGGDMDFAERIFLKLNDYKNKD